MSSEKHKKAVIDNGRMRICVEATDFKGRQYVDVRNYYTDAAGALQPTPKGLMIQADKLNAVIDALVAAAAQMGVPREARPKKALYFFARANSEEDNTTYRTSEVRVFEKLADAVTHAPDEFDTTGGYIFKSSEYALDGNMYVFDNPVPMARWSKRLEKWKRVPTE